MATAYVTSTGTAAYPGSLVNPTSLTNALAGAGAGDTIYIAPGNYTGISNVTYAGASGSSGSPVRFIGDATGSIFNLNGGSIRITAASNISTGTGNQILTFANKSYIEWSYVIFDRITPTSNALTLTTCQNFTFSNCIFYGSITAVNTAAAPWSHTFQRCAFFGAPGYQATLTSTNSTTTPWVFSNCVFMPINNGSPARALLIDINSAGAGGTVINCLFYGAELVNFSNSWSTSNPIIVKNCLFAATSAIYNQSTNGMVCSYNRYTFSSLTGVSPGTGSTTGGILGTDMFESLLFGIYAVQPYSSILGSPNTSFGNATGAPIADMYGVTWSGVSPDAGPATYRNIGGVSPYLPTERNASAITIAPGSTSQSIELYLGTTGLTFATSGLAAYYVRNQSAPVAITLVTQTPTGAWASGGFAEISSSLVPGVYRLDVPNAAFAAGASDVTIVVRGASGTNGAVLTVTLSSGGLTAAQTAAAVWDEPYTSHTTASTFGARTLKTTVDNRPVNVGTSFHIESNVHAVVSSTAAASELSGALLHNGTDYISAELLTPVSAATSVHIGPYQLLADGLGADQPLDVNVGTATSIDVQVTDANGTGIDITSATVTAKIYSSTGTLVATYAGTATYADNGRLTFGLTTTVTNTSGTYTVTVTRTTGATDTQIFGPLRLYVRPV